MANVHRSKGRTLCEAFKAGCGMCRYIGSLVGDFHRTLMYGGIYG